jgi:hypothetical protein
MILDGVHPLRNDRRRILPPAIHGVEDVDAGVVQLVEHRPILEPFIRPNGVDSRGLHQRDVLIGEAGIVEAIRVTSALRHRVPIDAAEVEGLAVDEQFTAHDPNAGLARCSSTAAARARRSRARGRPARARS